MLQPYSDMAGLIAENGLRKGILALRDSTHGSHKRKEAYIRKSLNPIATAIDEFAEHFFGKQQRINLSRLNWLAYDQLCGVVKDCVGTNISEPLDFGILKDSLEELKKDPVFMDEAILNTIAEQTVKHAREGENAIKIGGKHWFNSGKNAEELYLAVRNVLEQKVKDSLSRKRNGERWLPNMDALCREASAALRQLGRDAKGRPRKVTAAMVQEKGNLELEPTMATPRVIFIGDEGSSSVAPEKTRPKPKPQLEKLRRTHSQQSGPIELWEAVDGFTLEKNKATSAPHWQKIAVKGPSAAPAPAVTNIAKTPGRHVKWGSKVTAVSVTNPANFDSHAEADLRFRRSDAAAESSVENAASPSR